MNSWPDHYPNECPPSEAKEPDCNLFRFTNRKNPNERDFKSYYEIHTNKEWGDKACIARGLSVFCSMSDCIAMKAAIPAMKKKYISVATILPNGSGLVVQTPSQNSERHHTFWTKLSHEKLKELFITTEILTGANDD